MDLILFMADPTTPILLSDRATAEMLQSAGCPVWLVINKIDAVDRDTLAQIKPELEAMYPFERTVLVSAARGDNVQDLLHDIAQRLPEGPMYYPPDTVVDKPEEFLAAEMIREKLLERTREEVPHSVAVVVETMRAREERDIVDIDASILVERDSQKGIVIGAGGRMLREVGTAARAEIAPSGLPGQPAAVGEGSAQVAGRRGDAEQAGLQRVGRAASGDTTCELTSSITTSRRADRADPGKARRLSPCRAAPGYRRPGAQVFAIFRSTSGPGTCWC